MGDATAGGKCSTYSSNCLSLGAYASPNPARVISADLGRELERAAGAAGHVVEQEGWLLHHQLLQQGDPVVDRVAAGEDARAERIHHLGAHHRVQRKHLHHHLLAEERQPRRRGQTVRRHAA